MRNTTVWLAAECLTTPRLRLEPLRVGHADEAAVTFADPALYTFIGGEPPIEAQLRARYERQVIGHSPDGSQGWLNWMIRQPESEHLIGTVQATLQSMGTVTGTVDALDDAELVAELAWVVATGHQGHGYATEAAGAVMHWLRQHQITRFRAHIHPHHQASQRVAQNLSLAPTDTMSDGETRWVS